MFSWVFQSSLLLSLVTLARALNLIDAFDAGNWANNWIVEKIDDPTGGFVRYVDQGEAFGSGLMSIQNGQVYMGVDWNTRLNPAGPGRASVRLRSRNRYNRALVIADFAHMPHQACGVWPAFWMVGPNWPYDGEIDIIEGVNMQQFNQPTLHTSAGCVASVGPGGQSGSTLQSNCAAGNPVGNEGCSVLSNDPGSYGKGFNDRGGGVYATLWNGGSIQIWYFPRYAIPGDILNGNPNPAGWGQPQAHWGGCNFNDKMRDMAIMLDTTFCGGWAGGTWGSSVCAQLDGSCNAYVARDAMAFHDAYWMINYIRVYQL